MTYLIDERSRPINHGNNKIRFFVSQRRKFFKNTPWNKKKMKKKVRRHAASRRMGYITIQREKSRSFLAVLFFLNSQQLI